MPILIIEGCDKTGKTSLAQMLHRMTGAHVIKVSQPTTDDPLEEYRQHVNKLEYARYNFTIFDRFHLGEFVYGPIFRKATPNPFRAGRLEYDLARLCASVVLMEDTAEQIKARFAEHGEDFAQAQHVDEILERYEQVYQWSTLNRWRTTWSTDPAQQTSIANHALRFVGWRP